MPRGSTDGRSRKVRNRLPRRRCAVEQTKVPIPADVLEGLETVRLSGKTNMLDVPMVVKLALDMGHPQTDLWVNEHQALYAVGIFRGFDATDRLDENTLREMAEKFLDGEGGES
ncbi:MAG: DUF5049 domain-containing protein [Armatimonadetes bacterium]|nr:DUF5049 domain-containing protein [Armatimonadota bacterium]